MTDELKPCPFCGGEAEYKIAYGVTCHTCGAKKPSMYADAPEAWNTRTPTPVAPQGAPETIRDTAIEEAAETIGQFLWNMYKSRDLTSPAAFTSHTWQHGMEVIRKLKDTPLAELEKGSIKGTMATLADVMSEKDARVAELEVVLKTAKTVNLLQVDELNNIPAQLATARNEALEEAVAIVINNTPYMPPDGPSSTEHAVLDESLNAIFYDIRALKTEQGEGEV